MAPTPDPGRRSNPARRRFLAALDEWLTPDALHCIYTRRPAEAFDDPAFTELQQLSPDAADLQLLLEEHCFFWDLQQRDRDRAAQAARDQQALADYVTDAHRNGRPGRRRRKPQPSTHSTLPGL
jgi:hypothetical protein